MNWVMKNRMQIVMKRGKGLQSLQHCRTEPELRREIGRVRSCSPYWRLVVGEQRKMTCSYLMVDESCLLTRSWQMVGMGIRELACCVVENTDRLSNHFI